MDTETGEFRDARGNRCVLLPELLAIVAGDARAIELMYNDFSADTDDPVKGTTSSEVKTYLVEQFIQDRFLLGDDVRFLPLRSLL